MSKISFSDAFVQRSMYFYYSIHWSNPVTYSLQLRQYSVDMYKTKRSTVGNMIEVRVPLDADVEDVQDLVIQSIQTLLKIRVPEAARLTSVIWLSPVSTSTVVETIDNSKEQPNGNT